MFNLAILCCTSKAVIVYRNADDLLPVVINDRYPMSTYTGGSISHQPRVQDASCKRQEKGEIGYLTNRYFIQPAHLSDASAVDYYYLARSANFACVNFFFFLYFFTISKAISVSTGPIFKIFLPNGRYLREFS